MVNNLTNLTGTTSFYEIIEFNNSVTDGLFIHLFMVSFFFILFMIFMGKLNNEIDKALLGCSFLCLLLSITLVAIELLYYYYIFIFGVITGLSVFWVYVNKSKS